VLVAGLYFAIEYLDVRGVIAIVILIRVAEKLLVQLVVFRNIGFKASDIKMLSRVGYTAIISIFSGIVTFILYESVRVPVTRLMRGLADMYFSAPKEVILEFVTGSAILGVSFAAFAAVYLTASYFAGIIDESEKEYVRRLFGNPLRRTGN